MDDAERDALLAEIGDVERQRRTAADTKDSATERRRVIVASLVDAGVRQRDIADAAGVTVKTVEQDLVVVRKAASRDPGPSGP